MLGPDIQQALALLRSLKNALYQSEEHVIDDLRLLIHALQILSEAHHRVDVYLEHVFLRTREAISNVEMDRSHLDALAKRLETLIEALKDRSELPRLITYESRTEGSMLAALAIISQLRQSYSSAC